MLGPTTTGPFSSEPLEEVPLPSAPLLRVISQIRWTTIAQLKYSLDGIAENLALALTDDYPLVGQREEVQLILSPEGVDRRPAGPVHTLTSADGSWTVSIAESFLALDTSAYLSRDDFCGRLRLVLDAVALQVKIPRIERIGFRYVNRIDQDATYGRLSELINESLLGGAQVPLDGGKVAHSVSETLFQKGDVNLLTRWARLPAGSTLDPTIVASSNPSWVLDLDAFSTAIHALDPARNVESVTQLSQVAYRFFRWAVSPAFLREFGGSL